MSWYLIVYFLAGVVQDFFWTLNLRYVAKERTFLAVLFSFLTIVVSMVVLYKIINDLDPEESIIAIIIYAFGVAIGTFLAMKLKIGKKD